MTVTFNIYPVLSGKDQEGVYTFFSTIFFYKIVEAEIDLEFTEHAMLFSEL